MHQIRSCEVCSEPFLFEALPSKTKFGRFCSHRCKGIARTQWFEATFVQRFWARVAIGPQDSCWSWLSGVDKDGYGIVTQGGKKPALKAHRVAHELKYGLLLPGFLVCHRCDNPPCCNPTHTFPVTIQINNKDSYLKGRTLFGSRHPHSKLTEAQVREIMALKGLLSRKEISTSYGISVNHITHLWSGKKRPYLQGFSQKP